MKAIFIDAVNRKVEMVQIENDLHAFYEKIGCEYIECLDLGANHLAIIDEEGRLRNWSVGFQFSGMEGIAGNALIVSEDDYGDFADCKLSVKQVADKVRFLDLTKEPLPEPRQAVVPIEGELTEENINRAMALATLLMGY